MTEAQKEYIITDELLNGLVWSNFFEQRTKIEDLVRSRPYKSDKVLEEKPECFGTIRLILRKCLLCKVNEQCYDKRQELRQQERWAAMSDCPKLVDTVLSWWEEHKHDTTGYRGEYNVYDNEPEFVTIAKSINQDVVPKLPNVFTEAKPPLIVKIDFNRSNLTIVGDDPLYKEVRYRDQVVGIIDPDCPPGFMKVM